MMKGMINMRKSKLFITSGLIAVMALSSVNVFATGNESAPAIAPNAAQMHSTESDYISVDEYMAKYGRDNVIEGFNKAEAINDAVLNGNTSDISTASIVAPDDNEPNDLFLSLEEGKFLGLEIIGVSDLSPDDTKFSVKVKDNGFSENHNNLPTEDSTASRSAVAQAANRKVSYANYDVYYSDNLPGTSDLNAAYEPKSGSYIYKYSYAYDNNYLCSAEVQFSNTKLKCGTQNNNMYTYIAAKSSSQTLDFGLMANPSASNRNKGMYACYNTGGSFVVEAYPKVSATVSNNVMTLENKTVEIRLSIGNGTAEMYMGVNGSCIYYKTINMSSLVSGTSAPLTFIQAMSCVEANGNNTSLTSGSYFTNVRFNNAKLYSYDSSSARSFSTYGPYTYYLFAAKPSKISFGYGSTYESISISYN